MQSVILAGGKGTRLRPLTCRIPKSMVPIHGKPFIQYQLELIKSFGINEVLLLVSYLGEQIEEYFDNGSKLIENSELRKQIAEAGYNYINKNFTWDESTDLLEQLFQKALAEESKTDKQGEDTER